MKTAVDANVVLDMLTGTPMEIQAAESALLAAKIDGSILISAAAYAEVAARFQSKAKAEDFFSLLDCEVQPLDQNAAFLAGHFFRQYQKRGGTRARVLPDFLIAAHAQLNADRILTRDARFFGSSFPRLKAVSPADLGHFR
jgi:predicted nucleic acid-binding protein